jgi:hypothetical protein
VGPVCPRARARSVFARVLVQREEDGSPASRAAHDRHAQVLLVSQGPPLDDVEPREDVGRAVAEPPEEAPGDVQERHGGGGHGRACEEEGDRHTRRGPHEQPGGRPAVAGLEDGEDDEGCQ